jgi:hypothetical protein
MPRTRCILSGLRLASLLVCLLLLSPGFCLLLRLIDWLTDLVQNYFTNDFVPSLSLILRPIWGLRPDFYYCQTVAGLLMWGAFSDERTGLSFTIAAGPRQRSHSRVWVPRDSRPYFTVSYSRLPFLSPPTTRRATVEVFDSASTRGDFVLIRTAAYIAHRHPRKCLLNFRLHGSVFHTELVSKNPPPWKHVSQRVR